MIFKNLKCIIILLLFFCGKTIAQDSLGFTIKVKTSFKLDKIQLISLDQNLLFDESRSTKNINVPFEGSVKYPMAFLLTVNDNKKLSKVIFVENSILTINITELNPFNANVLGSYNQQLVDDFALMESNYWNGIYENDQKNKKTYIPETAFEARQQKYSKMVRDFVQNHSGDRASAYLANINSDYILDNDLQYISEVLSKTNQESDFGQQIKSEVKLRKNTELGTWLGDLEQKDLNGENLEFSDFKGKYVLLYFWRSDLEASRAENIRLKKWYSQFVKEPFEIIGVSLDIDPEAWERAVLEDNLNWNNISDLKGWDNKIAKRLGISMVPYSLLLDREGMIIGRDPKIEELDKIVPLMLAKLKESGSNNKITGEKEKKKKEKKEKEPKIPKAKKQKPAKVKDYTEPIVEPVTIDSSGTKTETILEKEPKEKKVKKGRFKPKTKAPKNPED